MAISAREAAQTWNREKETVEDASLRIHDGFTDLVGRANERIAKIVEFFPGAIPVRPDVRAMEIGGGVGYIMEALGRQFDATGVTGWRIIDLDIAEHMMAKAKERLGTNTRWAFCHYDGLTVPFSDHSLDFIYSIAALQHVPKESVHSLFFEIRRLLKPGASCVLEFCGMNHMLHLKSIGHSWRDYVTTQLGGGGDNWLWLWSREELEVTLKHGVGFDNVKVMEWGTLLFVCVS